ncbi:MAG: heavy metal-associated domain-containing protein [Bacillota bacterium]|nr:heavy metal-associated domain-containing protein [Bacillota bacterium]
MKKTYKLQDLGCAACAIKMEDAIKKLDGVEDVSINFMTSKLKLTAKESTDPTDQKLLDNMQEEISKIERDCKIVR